MTIDLLGIVEGLYGFGLSDADWIAQVAESLRPLLDVSGLGICGGFYECTDANVFRPSEIAVRDFSRPLEEVFWDGLSSLPAAFVLNMFLSKQQVRCSAIDVPGFRDIRPVRTGAFAAAGGRDVASIMAVEPDGVGCWFSSPQRARGLVSPTHEHHLNRIAMHLTAAHRLRRRLAGRDVNTGIADAVLTPDGRVCYAIGSAVAARDQLSQRVAARTRSEQGSAGWVASELDESGTRCSARWTLLDCFEGDGRRYVLAVESAPERQRETNLTDRELEIVRRATLGQENKVIAYELGVAESTVRVLMARASAKLGVRSRRELLSKLAPSVRDARRRVTSAASTPHTQDSNLSSSSIRAVGSRRG